MMVGMRMHMSTAPPTIAAQVRRNMSWIMRKSSCNCDKSFERVSTKVSPSIVCKRAWLTSPSSEDCGLPRLWTTVSSSMSSPLFSASLSPGCRNSLTSACLKCSSVMDSATSPKRVLDCTKRNVDAYCENCCWFQDISKTTLSSTWGQGGVTVWTCHAFAGTLLAGPEASPHVAGTTCPSTSTKCLELRKRIVARWLGALAGPPDSKISSPPFIVNWQHGLIHNGPSLASGSKMRKSSGPAM
mmetsp:Transcript_54040/g.150279  ORF Transcript_54040/g.150279 Transcript_54040/m.150279 type:complete len:242 (+) Transcript_54040:89-814(+)